MDPVELSREIEERYLRYLQTTFYFKDPCLRRSFEEALRSGRLSRGPYLEGTPVFSRASTPRQLFTELLGRAPDEGLLKAIDGDRPLYKHQEQAIRWASQDKNVVVATGTGSGKTEAFLYPILLALYQEFLAGQHPPGVRALILYPMNALANDQRDRLGEICKRLEEAGSRFGFTFGQYIGETPEDGRDVNRHAQDHIEHRRPGELVLRSEMRDDPPDILLTNYSMLEYLLLRPLDTPLFQNTQSWSHLVLDEAHQYRGARGIEMGMLLRRVKQRLREGGRSERFQCIATSASLAGNEDDRESVAGFAAKLFGEPFWADEVALGSTEPIPEPGPIRLPLDELHILAELMREPGARVGGNLREMAQRLDIHSDANDNNSRLIGKILQHERRATTLRGLVSGKAVEIGEVANRVFGDVAPDRRVPETAALVEILLKAPDPSTGSRLLSARYHLFLRSLEGAFVSYWPDRKVFLNRGAPGAGQMAFEVALCRECGQHYFVGKEKKGRLVEAIRDPSHDDFGADFFRPLDEPSGDEEESDDEDADQGRLRHLCIQCGAIDRHGLSCGHEGAIRVVRGEAPKDEDRADQMARCGACGYNAAGRDPVREIVHGTDGPNAVIATTLHQKLPADRNKVLAFADGRQEAAFFAWYLEDSYRAILSRNLILKAIRAGTAHSVDGLSLNELATRFRNVLKERRIHSPATGDDELLGKSEEALWQEFLTEEARISLEGVGLVKWRVKWPDGMTMPEILGGEPWSLTEDESRDLLLVLLDSLRASRAVDLRSKAGLSWDDLFPRVTQMKTALGARGKRKDFLEWDGRQGRRVGHLARLFRCLHPAATQADAIGPAEAAARAVWDHLRKSEEVLPNEARLLVQAGDACRLNPDWWRVRAIGQDDLLFRCDTCGRLQSVSVRGVCARHRCPGQLSQIRFDDVPRSHYRRLYEEDLPGRLRAEEHTAQLEKAKAREFQRDFQAGKIHVLSCSTTFELGVDLGDLDTIFLRNVPPEAFNYAQRVGRAGRRAGHPGFAITYCKRSPHDLYHFADPDRMLSGKVRRPTLNLRNEKIIARHVTATALSRFFNDERFKPRFENVEALLENWESPRWASDFRAYLGGHREEIERSLRAIVPAEMAEKVGLSDGRWIDVIAGHDSPLRKAEEIVASDYGGVCAFQQERAQHEDYRAAEWAKKRGDTIAGEKVLSYLSRKTVIPKYGFPVDVVELDTQRTSEGMDVSLQRDLSLAVAEFAPTAKLVANKKEWASAGLKKVAGKEWPRHFYKRCSKHNVYLQWNKEEQEPAVPQSCGDRCPRYEYVVPEFGFITQRGAPTAPKFRPPRVFTTRPYFVGLVNPPTDPILIPEHAPLVTLRKACPGKMAIICEGRRGGGFFTCEACGAGFRKRPESRHKTPWGGECRGRAPRVSLGHEFLTDVLHIQFHPRPPNGIDPVWFGYSLAYALVEGAAERLEVPSTDLNATVRHVQEHPVPPIVLYDNVPGGAGLVARLESPEELRGCLEEARLRVSGRCGCEGKTSCYGCLRGYRNQFAHTYLQRGPVDHYLRSLLEALQG